MPPRCVRSQLCEGDDQPYRGTKWKAPINRYISGAMQLRSNTLSPATRRQQSQHHFWVGTLASQLHCYPIIEIDEETMKIKTVALAAAFALVSTFAMAQMAAGTAGGSSKAGGPAASATTTGASMNGSTTGRSMKTMKNGRKKMRVRRAR